MSLKFVVDSINEGFIVELWNLRHRLIYKRREVDVMGVRSINCSSNFGDLLLDDEWPWYVKNSLGQELEELESYSRDYDVVHYQMKE